MVNRYIPSAATNTYYKESLYNNLSCGFPPDDSFHIFRGLESDYPWPGLTFGLTLLATYYFCTNQVTTILSIHLRFLYNVLLKFETKPPHTWLNVS